MELYVTIFAVAFIALLLVNFFLIAKVFRMSKKFKAVDSKMKVMTDNMNYIKGIELDFSTLEDKIASGDEQLQIEIESIFNKVTEAIDVQEGAIRQIESKVKDLDNLEAKLEDAIDAKI